MRVYRIPYSTNVERVALTLAHKSIPVDWIDVDPDDRGPVVALSGQDLVPVLATDHGEVVVDSMRIVSWLENRRPDPPLWPASPRRRAEVDVFIEWFNRVWKVPPNAIAAEEAKPDPDRTRIDAWSAELRGWLELFEGLLEGRDWLMGESFGAADVCAFPFLKYGVLPRRPDDEDPFHRALAEHLPVVDTFPLLQAWVHRVDALPRA
jgi:maleylacetoacetate isomerase